nr:hypothetical protein [Tanacetum cinerariifolium]
MVLYLVHDDVPTVPVLAIPAPHWDDVIVISSDEEYSSDDEKYDIPKDDAVPAVPWDMENASNQDDGKVVDNVVSNHETTVDNVMENASNQDDGKVVDNVVSNHETAVDNVVTTYYAGKIKLAGKIKIPEKSKLRKKEKHH